MKGIVFTEFLDMVEEKFGYQVVDKILTQSKLESGGVYTAVGTYSHAEIVALLMNLSDEVGVDPAVLLKTFGHHLFNTFLKAYPQFFEAEPNVFSFLNSIDNHIHVEVQKLYPDATLPKFTTEEHENGKMVMVYESERKMSALAEGLIEKALEHYKTPCSINLENLEEDGSKVRFTLIKTA